MTSGAGLFLKHSLCITQPPSQNTLPGGNTGLRLPAPRQAHSPSGYIGTYGYGSNFAVMSPRHMCARPGRRCPHFVLNWRYTEVFKILLHHKNSIHIDFLQPELFSQGREIF